MPCPDLQPWFEPKSDRIAPLVRVAASPPARRLAIGSTLAAMLAIGPGSLVAAGLPAGLGAEPAVSPTAPAAQPAVRPAADQELPVPRFDPQLEALIRTASLACVNALAARFQVEAASVEVWLTPGLRIAIEGGEAGVASLRSNGLAFGWMLRGRPAPAPIGLCRTKGNGSVIAIEQQPD